MPVNLGSHYLSKSAARKLLVAFNRTIKGTKDEPRTIRGISKMTDKELEDKLKEFQTKKGIGKNKGREILTHKRVKSSSYSQVIPKDTRRPKSEKEPIYETTTDKQGNIKKKLTKKKQAEVNKVADKLIEEDNKKNKKISKPTQAKTKKKRSAKQLANDKRLGEMARKRAAAKKNKK